MNNKKIKKAFAWASKNKIPFLSVIGSDEINTNKIKIKDMNKEQEITLDINNIEEIIKLIK